MSLFFPVWFWLCQRRKFRAGIVKSFPAGRKVGKIPLDKTPPSSLNLGASHWRGAGLRHRVSPWDMMDAQINRKNAGQIARRREFLSSMVRAKSREGGPPTPKDVKNEGRSGNVYENKGPNDTMTDNISGFCAWSHAILHKNTRILQKPTSFCHISSVNERTRALQNANSCPSRSFRVFRDLPDDAVLRVEWGV